jgi:hypothetical protein
MTMKRLRLPRLRISFLAISLAMLGWAVGCATPAPMIDPYFAARTYTPARVALMPADVFVVYDQFGDNDPQRSQALSQQVGAHLTGVLANDLQRRGYQVTTALGWDGIRSADGAYAVSGQELGWMANSILQFSGSPAGGGEGRMPAPAFIAPELAARVGSAAQSDSLLYVNIKGRAVSPGKRAAEVVGVVFFVVIVAAIILLIVAQSKSGGGGRSANPVASTGGGGRSVRSSGWRGPASTGGSPPTATTARALAPPPRGYGAVPRGGGAVYGGPRVGIGIGVVVPLEGPQHTHEGAVAEDDEMFAGDQAYLSATLVSTYDGRVLWHARQSIDVALDRPADVQKMVDRLVDTIPPSLSQAPAPAAPAH